MGCSKKTLLHYWMSIFLADAYSFIVSLEKLIDFVYFSSASITIAKYVNKGSFKFTVHYSFFKYNPGRACE
jgi:hypothetical protein